MAKLFLIDSWSEQRWWNTGGTRDKKIYLNPEDGEPYYFKQSYRKGEKDYKYEFWSEIVAYEVGDFLGFNVLPYHIAKRGEVLGCISKTMFTAEEELVEGGKYLQAYDPSFKPEDTSERRRYDFDLIVNSFRRFELDRFLPKIVEIIVFDALIGNSDRHQENWAIITGHSPLTKAIKNLHKDFNDKPKSPFRDWYERILFSIGKIRPEIALEKKVMTRLARFAPIYDSGCCFGRELSDEKVSIILENKDQLVSYFERGKAEIHWKGEKISHFKLVENLLESPEFKEITLQSLSKVIEKFSEERIKEIIKGIDDEMDSSGLGRHLPDLRKELIWELLDLRHQKLRDIYLKYQ